MLSTQFNFSYGEALAADVSSSERLERTHGFPRCTERRTTLSSINRPQIDRQGHLHASTMLPAEINTAPHRQSAFVCAPHISELQHHSGVSLELIMNVRNGCKKKNWLFKAGISTHVLQREGSCINIMLHEAVGCFRSPIWQDLNKPYTGCIV